MKIGELLKDVGEGVGKVAKRAGGVLEPIAERTAEVVSGQAPQIDAEQRRHAEKLEDAALAQKAAVLENNLAMGQKYGTLTPQQQQQYVDEISNLYSHPRHSRTLMEKLRKAIHPEGAVYTAPETALVNPTPQGGTAFQDEERAESLAKIRRPSREYASPDGKEREWFRPGEEPEGWQAIAGTAKPGKPMVVRLPNGQPGFASPQADGSFKDQLGNTIQATPFAKNPQTIKQGVSQGKNVYAQLSDEGWVDAGTKQPLADFRPNPSFAQTGLWAVDTKYDANGNPVPVLIDRRSGAIKPAPEGLALPMMAKDIETARTLAIGADTRLRNMIGSAARAKSGDQQAMLAITANHIGMTLGQQKGAKISQAVWNEAVESAPFLVRAEAHFDPNTGLLSGIVLTPDQIDQMVELGRLVRGTAWEATAQQAAAAGVNMQVPEFQLHPTGPQGVRKVGQILPKVPAAAAKPAAGAPTQDDPLGIFK